MSFVRKYADSILDRLVDEGVIIGDEPLHTDDIGSFGIFEVSIAETGDSDYLKFAHEFAESNYPNEFGTPSPTAVQIVLKGVRDRGYRGVDLDVAAIFYVDDLNRHVLMLRIVGGKVYADGGVFSSPRLAEIINVVNQLNAPQRVLPEVGEV